MKQCLTKLLRISNFVITLSEMPAAAITTPERSNNSTDENLVVNCPIRMQRNRRLKMDPPIMLDIPPPIRINIPESEVVATNNDQMNFATCVCGILAIAGALLITCLISRIACNNDFSPSRLPVKFRVSVLTRPVYLGSPTGAGRAHQSL